MSQVVILVLKGLFGGLIVVAFALIGEVVRPRGLAGISSAAPSVALASLAVALVASGVSTAVDLSLGMIAGAVALIAWCFVGLEAVKRLGALRGSAAATVVWLVASLSMWAAFLR